jgi:hypothetical protein
MPPAGSSHVRFPVLTLLALLVLPAPAAAAERTIDKSRHLWATVNICDTRANPDTLGIRASMPGSGRRTERMYMRFRAQFFSRAENRWRDFSSAGTDSGWVRVGSARFKARQSGWSFPFRLKEGQRYELRGVVRFEWRRGTRVVRKAVKRTTAGHGTAFSDPRGYSSATCQIGA